MPIIVEAVGCTDANVLEESVNEDIERFETFFKSLGNDGLSPYEKSAIKTFLWWKTHEEPDAKETHSPF